MTVFLALLVLVLVFVAGVAESNRVINELHKIAGEIHAKIDELKGKV